MQSPVNRKHSEDVYTAAGKAFVYGLTDWYQDTRLMSEAVFRLVAEHGSSGSITFNSHSWRKNKGGNQFTMQPKALNERLSNLQQALWVSRFVFLETVWEQYLLDLVKELAQSKPTWLEAFSKKDLNLLPEVLRATDLNELHQIAAIRIAENITRQSWSDQWASLTGLNVGLSRDQRTERWWQKLDVYFEMRNCFIHRAGQPSSDLLRKDPLLTNAAMKLEPDGMDFFRLQFLECVKTIERAVHGRLNA